MFVHGGTRDRRHLTDGRTGGALQNVVPYCNKAGWEAVIARSIKIAMGLSWQEGEGYRTFDQRDCILSPLSCMESWEVRVYKREKVHSWVGV